MNPDYKEIGKNIRLMRIYSAKSCLRICEI